MPPYAGERAFEAVAGAGPARTRVVETSAVRLPWWLWPLKPALRRLGRRAAADAYERLGRLLAARAGPGPAS